MIRGSWIYDRKTGELVPKHLYRREQSNRSDVPCPMVIRDIEPYRSMVDGSIISGRRQHRDHLKAHGMVELGNDMPKGPKYDPALDESAIAEAYDRFAQGDNGRIRDRPPEPWEGTATGDDWQDKD